jgi:hypothetical protein
MKKLSFVVLSVITCAVFFICPVADIKAQAGLTPAAQTMQNELMKNFEITGYGDYELDLIHQKIGLLVPKLKNRMEKDASGEERLKLEVTAGETIHSNGDHYLVYGYAYIYPGEPGKLKKIVMEYIRQTASGASYKREKRELINPSPVFNGENMVDSNNDIVLSYYSAGGEKEDYKKIRETVFSKIDRHDRKIKLILAYKNYLRKTLHSLELNITNIELANVMELLNMLEFE